ncbi:MAG: glycosyltransferase [bacterium]|nr:glycosyltransferase [bacterium]
MTKITALVPVQNEEANLPECLDGLGWVDEIFVVDGYSTDRTVEIAESYGARVVQHEYKSNAAQKNWAIPQCAHEWVLIVEGDERVTPALRDEIQRLLDEGPRHDAYYVYRRNFVYGHEVRRGGWERDKVIRLIHRDRCRYENRQVAPEIMLDKPAGWLRERMPHYPYREFDQYYAKFQRYTVWSAIEMHKQGRRAHLTDLTLRPFYDFFKQYILRLGVLDGTIGLILAGQTACYVFTKYARLWYMQTRTPSKPAD